MSKLRHFILSLTLCTAFCLCTSSTLVAEKAQNMPWPKSNTLGFFVSSLGFDLPLTEGNLLIGLNYQRRLIKILSLGIQVA